jgi:hypothetical protein
MGTLSAGCQEGTLTVIMFRSCYCVVLAATLLLFGTGCSVLTWSRFPPGADWMLFDVSAMRYYYYHPDHIERVSDTIAKVTILTVIKGDEGQNWEIDERMKRGLPFGGYEKYESSQDVYALDCQGKKFQTLSGADYDNEGNTLSSYSHTDLPWEPVPPGSALDVLSRYRSVCP